MDASTSMMQVRTALTKNITSLNPQAPHSGMQKVENPPHLLPNFPSTTQNEKSLGKLA